MNIGSIVFISWIFYMVLTPIKADPVSLFGANSWVNAPDGCTLVAGDCTSPAQYQFDSVTSTVSLSGLVQYTDDSTPLGSNGQGQIGYIDEADACPAHMLIFSVTNLFGLSCVVSISPAGTHGAGCLINLAAWSLPTAYYYTGALDDPRFEKAYYVVNNAEIVKNGASAFAECECEQGQAPSPDDCVQMVIKGGSRNGEWCVDLTDMKFVSLDGIVYTSGDFTPSPTISPPDAGSIGSINLDPTWVTALSDPPPPQSPTIINAPTYEYDGFMVTISEATKTGLIQYDDDSTPMGGAEGGLIGTFGAASFCPNQPEEFRITNGFGLDCVVEVRPEENGKCPIYLLAWSIPTLYYYTGAFPDLYLRGQPVDEKYYVVDDAAVLNAAIANGNGPDPSLCQCTQNPGSGCAQVYPTAGHDTDTCRALRDLYYVSLNGISYIPHGTTLSQVTGSIEFETDIWNDALKQGEPINPAQYKWNGHQVLLSGLIQYVSDNGPMGNEGNGRIGEIKYGPTNICPEWRSVFAVTNGLGVDCVVQVDVTQSAGGSDDASICPIDLFAWSIPLAYYYTGAYDGTRVDGEFLDGPSYYVVDSLQLVESKGDPSACGCTTEHLPDGCYTVFVGGQQPKCIPAEDTRLVSLDGISFTGADVGDVDPAVVSGDPHFVK